VIVLNLRFSIDYYRQNLISSEVNKKYVILFKYDLKLRIRVALSGYPPREAVSKVPSYKKPLNPLKGTSLLSGTYKPPLGGRGQKKDF
jgi:hypothetical protein